MKRTLKRDTKNKTLHSKCQLSDSTESGFRFHNNTGIQWAGPNHKLILIISTIDIIDKDDHF